MAIHTRSGSITSIASSSRPASRIAVVGRGREALALSPNSAEKFRQNLNLAVCSSPELTAPSLYPRPNPNPGPILRRIVSETPLVAKPQAPRCETSKMLPPVGRGLPPPPRSKPRRRPPPVFVTTLGAPLATAEQTFSPFVPPSPTSPSPERSASMPPSAVSSSFWGCAGDLESDPDSEYEFSDSPLGATFFPAPSEEPARQLCVQMAIERVAFCDEHGGRDTLDLAGDGIKTRVFEAVEAVPPRATKVSIGRALGKWFRRCA